MMQENLLLMLAHTGVNLLCQEGCHFFWMMEFKMSLAIIAKTEANRTRGKKENYYFLRRENKETKSFLVKECHY